MTRPWRPGEDGGPALARAQPRFNTVQSFTLWRRSLETLAFVSARLASFRLLSCSPCANPSRPHLPLYFICPCPVSPALCPCHTYLAALCRSSSFFLSRAASHVDTSAPVLRCGEHRTAANVSARTLWTTWAPAPSGPFRLEARRTGASARTHALCARRPAASARSMPQNHPSPQRSSEKHVDPSNRAMAVSSRRGRLQIGGRTSPRAG